MIDLNLITYMNEELRRTPIRFHRYVYDKILWEDRMVGIVGPRGVGKSTMVKQHILRQPDRDRWLYVSADNSYFVNNTLISLTDDWIKEGGAHLVIDETHK